MATARTMMMVRTTMMAKTINTQQSTERGSGRNGGDDGKGDGYSNDNNRQGRQQQWARTVMTTGKDNDNGKEDDSKDNGNDGKDNQQGW
jgi:hypothetical protein